MPANLTPAYRTAEAAFKAAVTREEKLAALEEMLRAIPKHKGTEKMQADIRSRISRLKKEPAKKAGARGPSHRIPREGAGQVVLVGPPNAGKSALVAHLTAARPEVADYPMTTRDATPGMMAYGDISFQLVDLPPLCEEYVENWVYDVVRGADLAWLVVSLDDPLGGLELTERLLAAKAIRLIPVGAAGPLEEERRPGWTYLPALLVVTRADRGGAREDVAVLAEMIDPAWQPLSVSVVSGVGLRPLGDRTFDALDIIRVYTKEPGHEADRETPFTLPRGATVATLARAIHADIAEQLKWARVWGPSAFDGQRVTGEHPLADGDIVEIRM
jgi:uncharacterized protein